MTWFRFDAGTDLRKQFALVTEKALAAGWTVENHDPGMGCFFCHREGSRLHVVMRPTAPQNPLAALGLAVARARVVH
jgi:hypothetical protein